MCGWTGHIQDSEAELGQRSAFCKPAATGAAKAGNRNHQGEGISDARLHAEMGSPWSVSFFDTLKRRKALLKAVLKTRITAGG